MENPKMAPADVAMDFMRGLDIAKYTELKTNLFNEQLIGGTKRPETLNDMYSKATNCIGGRGAFIQFFFKICKQVTTMVVIQSVCPNNSLEPDCGEEYKGSAHVTQWCPCTQVV